MYYICINEYEFLCAHTNTYVYVCMCYQSIASFIYTKIVSWMVHSSR